MSRMLPLPLLLVAALPAVEVVVRPLREIEVRPFEDRLIIGAPDRAAWVMGATEISVLRWDGMGTGASLECAGLDGQRRYLVRLEAIGPVDHSKYRNAATLEDAGENLVIRGRESAGSYVEIRRKADGALVSSTVERPAPPP